VSRAAVSLAAAPWAAVPLAAVLLGGIVVSCWQYADPETGANAGGASSGSLPGSSGSTGSPVSSNTDQGPNAANAVGSTDNSEATSPALPLGGSGTPGSSDTPQNPGNSEAMPTLPLGAAGSANNTGSAGASGQTPVVADAACDILAAAGNACGAAHSTVRILYAGYTGPLYQVCRGASVAGPNFCPGGVTRDIGVVDGGYADSAAQDAFCAGGTCTISIIYDQSPNHNDLKPAPAGGAKNSPDNPVNATDLKTTLNGHTVYGVFIKAGFGYRAGCNGCGTATPIGTAINDEPETEYMVTSQTGLVNGCCFDYGNGETDSRDDGNGTMEALYFGGGVVWGTGSPGGHNNGPWVMADLENGLYAGWENNQDQNISTNTPLKLAFVTGMLIGDTADKNAGKGRFALYGGDAKTGPLKVLYDGTRPAKNGYVPMHKQGSIILGIGGDNSDGSGGQWFEGVMASGAATLATMNAVQANIVAAGYGK